MASYDVTVHGAGIFGLCIAWACVEAGARVTIVDPGGVGAGSSGGIVGALAPHVPENWNAKKQFQLESLSMAGTFWSRIAQASGQDPGYRQVGRIQPLLDQPAVDLAQARAGGASALWRGAATWDVIDNAKGWSVPSPTGRYIFDTLSAHLHPRRACNALAAALADRGVSVMHDAPPLSGLSIWATGAAGLDALSEQHTRSVGQGIKGQAALLEIDRRDLPQLFVDTVHIIPHSDGTVAVGSTTERDFDDAHGTDAQLDALIQRASRAVPELAQAAVLERWAGLRPRARSRAPMLGAWPGRPGHFIANGGFKIGFGMAPKVGQALADLVLLGKQTYPDEFDVAACL